MDKQEQYGWGKSIVKNLSLELQKEFVGMRGFSERNLWNMRNFYIEYKDNEKLQSMTAEIGKFKPEYAGKMSFYLSVLNDKIKLPDENPSIGIVICKDKKRTTVEYALKETNQPIGVATYKLSKELPNDLQEYLPSVSKIEEILVEYMKEIK